MRLRFIPIWAALALLAGAVGTSAQSTSTAAARESKDQPPTGQVKVAIDPRSSGEWKQRYSQMVFATYARMFLSFVMNLRRSTSFLQAEPALGFYAITTSHSMTSRGEWCSQPTNIPAKMLSTHSVNSSMLKSSPATIYRLTVR
jgi:hypothetical protein